MLLTMFIVSLAIFMISELVPIDIARNVLGQFASPESLQIFREQNGLVCAPTVRYVIWLVGDDWVEPARNPGPGRSLGLQPARDRQGYAGDLGTRCRTALRKSSALQRLNLAILAGIAFVDHAGLACLG
jgi:hypothetical protein